MYKDLKEDIKFNCDVSDARYWGYFSICGLLLRYRDLYRSEQGLKPWSDIPRSDIAAWIEAKESRWPELEQQDFRKLTVHGQGYHPFDVDGVNHALEGKGLVYGAGYGMYMKPTFFLAELKSSSQEAGLIVHTSGLELVRDLFTSPAMLQEDTVFLRIEPLMLLLHFKFSELNVKSNSALEDAFAHYGFQHRQLMDDTLEKRLEGLASRYAGIILRHEIAEHKESIPEWKDILTAAGDRKNEHYLRALKDLIADTSDSGPLKQIIDAKDRGGLGLTVALMEGYRRALFPGMKDAYAEFISFGNWDVIEKARTQGHARFTEERKRIVDLWKSGSRDFAARLKASLPL